MPWIVCSLETCEFHHKFLERLYKDTRANVKFKLSGTVCYVILQYCDTPSRKDGLSPAQKLYGRPIRDTLPAHRHSFAPEWQRSTQAAEQQATYTLQQSEAFYNIHTRSLPDIQIGSSVALQNPQTKLWDIYGTIVDIGPHRRYYIKTHSGQVLARNRRFLRHRTPASLNLPGTTAQGLTNAQPSCEPHSPYTTLSQSSAHLDPQWP